MVLGSMNKADGDVVAYPQLQRSPDCLVMICTPCIPPCRYKQYWEQATHSGAAGVSITSFNEWGEGTQIEAAKAWDDPDSGHHFQDYGANGPQLYMKLTGQYAKRFTARLSEQQQQRRRQNDNKKCDSEAGEPGPHIGSGIEADVPNEGKVDAETQAEATDVQQQEL